MAGQGAEGTAGYAGPEQENVAEQKVARGTCLLISIADKAFITPRAP
jgi:hypothetical protein